MPASRDLEEESQKNIYSKRNLKRRGIIRLASKQGRLEKRQQPILPENICGP
jgi:hypothetical protein